MKRTDTQTLINLLRLVSNETEGASAIVREAADRLEEMVKERAEMAKAMKLVRNHDLALEAALHDEAKHLGLCAKALSQWTETTREGE